MIIRACWNIEKVCDAADQWLENVEIGVHNEVIIET